MLLSFTANEGKSVLENTSRWNTSSKEKEEEESSRESEARHKRNMQILSHGHIAITFISYLLSGILLKRVNNINPKGIYA